MPPRPVKLAIVGGGPSAFYVASRLLSFVPHADTLLPSLRVHIFDRLWAPHGLVRYGVAPDHPEVKNCTHKFDQTAADPRFRFFGNVHVGSGPTSIPHALSLTFPSLLHSYTHILFATGCTLPTLHPDIPPSSHCVPALSLVHWYTRHPSNPPPPALDKITHISLIGNGNVSLDIARMLLTSPDILSKYDIPEHVLDVLFKSTVEHVSIIGRRGPLEAAFTNKELREMMHLPDVSMVPLDPSLLTFPEGTIISRQQRRTLELLRTGSQSRFGTTRKTWSLDFYRAPTTLTPSHSSAGSAELALAHTRLDPSTGRAISTNQTSTLTTSLVVTSLGFHVDPIMTFFDPSSKHLRTHGGRILSQSGVPLRNMYASGWCANGAKGVLATTMMDAYAVADTILSDLKLNTTDNVNVDTRAGVYVNEAIPGILAPNIAPHPDDPPEEIKQGIKDGRVTQYGDWNTIDVEEARRGALLGKERERMDWEDARKFLLLPASRQDDAR